MPSFKIDRTTEDIHRELTAILREVKDPRVKDCLLSLVRVEVTNDLSYCTVYVSTMEGLERSKTAVQGLKSAAGFIRRELGKRLSLRHVPQLLFKATDSIEYGTHISQLLHHLAGIFREQSQPPRPGGLRPIVDKKLRRKIREKKIAMGHKPDDHEEPTITM